MTTSSEEIWRGFSRQLLGFLRRRASDPSEAEDLLQEVFLKVHTRIQTLQDHARLAPWLFQIARNTLIDHERKRRPGAPLDEELPADSGPPVNESERQIAASLLRMVEELPAGYREAVGMYELEGLKQDEIARRLGLSLSGAKSRIQRGREMLRQALLACCHFDFDMRGRIMDYRERQDCCACCASGPRERAAEPHP